MLTLSQLAPFVLASLVLVAIPGPAVAFLVARSASEGRRVGLLSAAGVALGNYCHALLAAFGVSAAIASSPWAFEVLRFAGAAYLIYLGIRSFLTKSNSRGPDWDQGAKSNRSAALDGFLVGLFNPKVVLFLLAFLPQFADPSRGRVGLQLFLLGTLFTVIGWIGDSLWAALSGTVAGWMKRDGKGGACWRYVSGFVFCLLGLAMIFARS